MAYKLFINILNDLDQNIGSKVVKLDTAKDENGSISVRLHEDFEQSMSDFIDRSLRSEQGRAF